MLTQMKCWAAKLKTDLPIALSLVLTVGCTGCQTFSLTQDQFDSQQRGQCADPEVGAVVGTFGTLGYLGAVIGAAAAGVK
jgi:hypothetical protein